MRSFKTVCSTTAELLKQHAARGTSTGEIDLTTQIEINRLADQIRLIGQTRTNEVPASSLKNQNPRTYRRKIQAEGILVS